MSKAKHLADILQARVLESDTRIKVIREELREMGRFTLVKAGIVMFISYFFILLFVASVLLLPVLFIYTEQWRLHMFILTGSFVVGLITMLWMIFGSEPHKLLREKRELEKIIDKSKRELEIINKVL